MAGKERNAKGEEKFKSQNPNKVQVPKFQSQAMPKRDGSAWATGDPTNTSKSRVAGSHRIGIWDFGICLGFGIWILGFQPGTESNKERLQELVAAEAKSPSSKAIAPGVSAGHGSGPMFGV